MKITRVTLKNFRNIEEAELSLVSNEVVLTGPNGQGKTNVLEAVGLLLSGNSFRARADSELIKDGEQEARVSAVLGLERGLNSVVSIVLREEGDKASKDLKLDDKKVSPANLLAMFPVVFFTPEEVDLIRSESMRRRRVVDGLGVRISEEYRQLLTDYVRVWRHRNQLLLAVKQRRASEEELDVWDEKMAEVGSGLVLLRQELVGDLSSVAQKKHQAFGLAKGADLKLGYLPNIQATKPDEYLQILRSARVIDIARAHTTRGIHRDDVAVLLSGMDALKRASRGEFRSIVLSLKLAEGEILKAKLQESPIYLLDDVWSELDEGRRSALREEVGGNQMIVTTHEEVLDSGVLVYEVSDGKVRARVAV